MTEYFHKNVKFKINHKVSICYVSLDSIGWPKIDKFYSRRKSSMASTLKFCPDCRYYMALKSNSGTELRRVCINCNRSDVEEKGGLISEMKVQQKSSEAFKIMINEFTRQDNTLPHIKMIPCPSETCPSNTDDSIERDVIYMTYDNPGKKNLYICNVCGEQWKSRS